MKIEPQWTDSAVLHELGKRIASLRIDRNLTQAALAEQAGVSKRTVERLESGAVSTQLSGFLRICRVLGAIERLDMLLPESAPGPMLQLKQRGRKRSRASGTHAAKPPSQKWTWGENQ